MVKLYNLNIAQRNYDVERTIRAKYPWHKMQLGNILHIHTEDTLAAQHKIAASLHYYRERYDKDFKVKTKVIEKGIIEIRRVG